MPYSAAIRQAVLLIIRATTASNCGVGRQQGQTSPAWSSIASVAPSGPLIQPTTSTGSAHSPDSHHPLHSGALQHLLLVCKHLGKTLDINVVHA